jgi:hypothetical protein
MFIKESVRAVESIETLEATRNLAFLFLKVNVKTYVLYTE